MNRASLLRDVMPRTVGGIDPHTHPSVRRWIDEDLVGALPTVGRKLRFTMSAQKETSDNRDKNDRTDDDVENDERGHEDQLAASRTTAVP
jgi:hypothetical protein